LTSVSIIAVDGAVDPGLLTDIGPRSLVARSEELGRWLDSTAPQFRNAQERDSSRRRLSPSASAHDAAIHAFCLWFDQPFRWDGLNAALQALTTLRGPDLLRVKGIVHVEGERGPVVLQGAQHVFHPPVTLEHGRDTDPRSRIVFIVRNITRESIEALFAAVGALGNSKET
jgi:G3E family GTPase